ncbi:NADH:ubiquinone reductase (Na(+)-transporting) subunit B [Kiritimatiella glycovorans]|uniref:Na(+)-translocating NADH-quinone reductase subunit B n=1 Tax=Kiritimatiella glycovorans TaxID=1307763 RepID=A0A0G3EEQ3_9BACT|nr:NADH:ubiquinone reductase (Na(+)-transporting) subunit B [Kiritimatiella glycovorans]AKJ63852.1 Na(+)-translocating NADH-quinone reductase subunit B [Kiritimatiella glycovorans]
MKFDPASMMERMRPLFEKGGTLHRIHPLFEAGDTFMRTPPDVTSKPPHVRDAVDLKRVMIFVLYALMPCFLFGAFNAGYQANAASGAEAGFVGHLVRGLIIVLPIVITSYAVGGLWEVLFACVRRHEINEGFLVTGMLFPLTLPPTIPLWQVAAGISFGVVIGKEIFGGTGYNILNPALTARAFLFFAYPVEITGDRVWVAADAVTRPTPLSVAESASSAPAQALQEAGYDFMTMFGGLEPGSIGSTSVIAVLLGLGLLLLVGVASWRIILSGVIGLSLTSLLFNFVPAGEFGTYAQLPFYYHLIMGGFAFGIVFMATDPVSAATTTAGKWIYGFMIGFLTAVIRVFNPAFPEGVMLAILFMNVMAPLIDHGVLRAHIRDRQRYLGRMNHA